MSYEMMEGLLIERIAELRACEANAVRSYGALSNGSKETDLSTDFSLLQHKLSEVESLLSAMDERLLPSGFLAAGPPAPLQNAALWS